MILIRTHFGDEPIHRMAAWLSAGRHDVVVVADESGGFVETRSTPKISLNAQTTKQLGLYDRLGKPYWRCGDYALIAARVALPNYDRYWMVETDVRLNSRTPQEFFDRFEAAGADFIAGHIRPAEEGWDWRPTMSASDGPIWRALFPLVRLSGAAIDAVADARRMYTEHAVRTDRDPLTWPNDEVFTASVLKRRGFDCQDLNAYGDVYSPETFRFWWATSDRMFAQLEPDNRAYHPVLSGEAYFLKLLKIGVAADNLDAVAESVRNLTGVEWSPHDAKRYLAVVEHTRTNPPQRINAPH